MSDRQARQVQSDHQALQELTAQTELTVFQALLAL